MKKRVAIVVLASAMLFGCADKQTEKDGKVLAKVGSVVITDSDIDQELENMPANYKSYYSSEEGREKVLKNIIEKTVLAIEGKKEGLENTDEYKEELEKAKELILAKLYVEKKIFDPIKISEEELQAEYDKNKANFFQEEQVKASHILIKTSMTMTKEEKEAAKKLAEEAFAKVQEDGADFAELAKEYSQGPTGPKGGDLGWFGRGRVVKDFSDAAFSGEVGKIYPEIVETQFGYHIIKIEGKKEETYKTLEDEEVRKSIEEPMINSRKDKTFKEVVDGLTEKYLEKEEDSAEKEIPVENVDTEKTAE